MNHALHGHHLPCLLGFAIEMASLFGWKERQGVRLEPSQKNITPERKGPVFLELICLLPVPEICALGGHTQRGTGDGNLLPTFSASETLTLVLASLRKRFPKKSSHPPSLQPCLMETFDSAEAKRSLPSLHLKSLLQSPPPLWAGM